MKIEKILTKNKWGIVDKMIQMVMTFVKDTRLPSKMRDVLSVVKSINPFPSMQPRLLKTRRTNPMPIVSCSTKRQGPTFSNFDIPKLPDNNDMQRFIVNNKGKKSNHPPKGQLISECPFDVLNFPKKLDKFLP